MRMLCTAAMPIINSTYINFHLLPIGQGQGNLNSLIEEMSSRTVNMLQENVSVPYVFVYDIMVYVYH